MNPSRQKRILNYKTFCKFSHAITTIFGGTLDKGISSTIGANLLRVLLPCAIFYSLIPSAAAQLNTSQDSAVPSDKNVSSSESTLGQPLGQTCQNNTVRPTISSFASNLVQIASWVGKPQTLMDSLIQYGPQLAAYFKSSPWPTINEQAKLARVPVLMYHDILPEKEVFFDVTPKEFEDQLRRIQENGLTPISFDQLMAHLKTGLPLPEKPIMLTFDDGYGGHYQYVYPLLKKYGYPAVFSVYTSNMGKDTGRTHVTWEQLQQMAADPLVTIASHSVSHPPDLRVFPDDKLETELVESKRILESRLGIPIRYFTYPVGKYDARVADLVSKAGYQAALTMDDLDDRFAGQSKSLLAIDRIGQSSLEKAIAQAWGGPKLTSWGGGFDFTAPVELTKTIVSKTPLILISGGRPITIHAKSRYQVPEILAGTQAIAAVDGGFFSLKFLDSNVMIGPVLSSGKSFIPGYKGENPKLTGRPLVLINPQSARFVPFDAQKHNTLEGIQSEMADVTDAFVAAAWLVRDGQPQPKSSFGKLFGFDAARHRAFWGINRAGKPTIGVSTEPIDAVGLGAELAKAGLQDVVMLDSGASTSLAYKGESLVGYTPRPVPHVVALMPSQLNSNTDCNISTTIK